MVQYQPGGSSRGDLVQSQAISSANQQMLNKAAEMYQNAYQGAQSRVPEFLRQYPSTLQAPMSMYSSLGDVGKQQQALNQAAINNAMQEYQYKATAPQSALKDYMQMVQGNYGGTERATGPSPFGSSFMGALGKGLATGITGGLF